MQFHVWLPGESLPQVFEDEVLLRQQIAQAKGPVVVKKYQHALVATEVYGLPGGLPMPSPPANPVPVESVAIPHIRRQL